jgi:hypothetical protein
MIEARDYGATQLATVKAAIFGTVEPTMAGHSLVHADEGEQSQMRCAA